MKNVILAGVVMLFSVVAFAQSNESQVSAQGIEKATVSEALYVILLENSLETKEIITAYEISQNSRIAVVEAGDKVKLIFQGVEGNTETMNELAKSVKIYKGSDAKARYPKVSSQESAYEIELKNDRDVVKVVQSLITS